MAAGGFGLEFLGEPRCAEEAEHGVGRVLAGRREQFIEAHRRYQTGLSASDQKFGSYA